MLTLLNVLAWLIFGTIVGLVANFIDSEPAEGGLVGAIILGILGALVGGFFGNLIFGVGVSGFNLSSLVIATIGSLILMFVGRRLTRWY